MKNQDLQAALQQAAGPYLVGFASEGQGSVAFAVDSHIRTTLTLPQADADAIAGMHGSLVNVVKLLADYLDPDARRTTDPLDVRVGGATSAFGMAPLTALAAPKRASAKKPTAKKPKKPSAKKPAAAPKRKGSKRARSGGG
jgi:hypothetical protein